jgi:hypothetical protein
MRAIKENKRGLSGIVTTLLFVVLGLVAIGAVWAVVRNVIQDNSKQVQTGTLTVTLDILNAYEENGIVYVKVTRGTGKGDVVKLKFLLSDGTDKDLVTKEVTGFEEFSTLDFELTSNKFIPGTIETVAVAAVVKSGETEILGEIADIQALRNLYNQNGGDEGGDEEGEEEQGCTPDCGARVCGAAPNACNGANGCGTCQQGTCSVDQLTCENCVPAVACPVDLICGTTTDGCGGTLQCGDCPAGSLCSSDQKNCNEIVALNSGIVDETWPGTSGLYFGSSTLPIDVTYQGKYVKFPGSAETGCFLIVSYRFPVDGYAKSHVAFNFETQIVANDNYQIFNTYNECTSAL